MSIALRAALLLVSAAFVAACGADRTTAPVIATTSAPAEEPAPEAPAPTPEEAQVPSDAAEVKTLFVHEARVDCEGVGPQKCLQIRESESDDWTLLYSAIKGFSYEEGTRYELRVKREPSPHAGAADAPSHHYVLVEIVSEEKVP